MDNELIMEKTLRILNIIAPITFILGIIALLLLTVNIYKAAMIKGVLKNFNMAIKNGILTEDNEIIVEERKKLKELKESLIMNSAMLFISGCITMILMFKR